MHAMDGENEDEVLHRRKKAGEFAESMQAGFLSKDAAWLALAAAIMKTMEHPMAAAMLTEKEREHAVVPTLRPGSPRSGADRSFP